MGRKYPPLTPLEIEDILVSRGFVYERSRGDHKYYYREVNGVKHIVQIDTGASLINNKWIKLTIQQSGLTREQFYCSTKATAKKIGLKKEPREVLLSWGKDN